jgi:hypothetical protein
VLYGDGQERVNDDCDFPSIAFYSKEGRAFNEIIREGANANACANASSLNKLLKLSEWHCG